MDTFHPKKKVSLIDILYHAFTLQWKKLWAIFHHLKQIKWNKIINFTSHIYHKFTPRFNHGPSSKKRHYSSYETFSTSLWSYIQMTKFLELTKLGQLGVLQLWGFKHTTLFITLVESFEQHCVQLLNKKKMHLLNHTLSDWEYFGNFCLDPSNHHKFWPKHLDFDNGKPRSYSPHFSLCMVCNSSHLAQTMPWVYNMPTSVLSCCNLGLEPKVRVVINVFCVISFLF